MSYQNVPLGGSDWHFKGYLGEDWRWRGAHRPGGDSRGWLPATVPGSVHHDLWQQGQIADPYQGRNSLLCEWVPARTWLYKKRFPAPAAWRGRQVRLCLEGIDYEAEIFLNGERLGEHRGMFTPAVFDVGDRLLYDEENLLAVVLAPAPAEQPQVGRTSRVTTHKTRMNYWWDFCPRMVHSGIWDDVYLAVTGPARLEDVAVRSRLCPSLDRADVAVAVEVAAAEEMLLDVETTLSLEGQVVARQGARHLASPGRSALSFTFELERPQLWWPNGYGAQSLYEAEVVLLDAESLEASDGRRLSFGIRHIELVANQTEDPTARPYTLVVNGRKLYLKGWNWVPMDVLYGVERPEKLAHLLTLAARAHVNLLRVWGGGLIEKEAFYRLCDRLGLLVWQEFIQSSSGIDNTPSTEEAFITMLAGQAEQIVRRRRNHPSLAIWCGGNELQAGPEQPLDDSHPALAALRDVVRAHDPGRLWLPTSPTGRLFSNSLENIAADPTGLHDVHGPWEHQGVVEHFTLYNQGTSLLHSEFGVEGITNRASLDAVIPPEAQWPVSLDNALWHHLGAWWLKEKTLRAAFGDWPDVATAVRAGQFLQADGLRYAVEANRRRQYQNSGSIPWQFNEPYPMAACTSAVDYFGRPKPAYYTVRRAYAPLLLSARFERQAWAAVERFTASVWASHDGEAALAGLELRARLLSGDGRTWGEERRPVRLGANCSEELMEVSWPLPQAPGGLFFLDLALRGPEGAFLAGNRYLFSSGQNLEPLLAEEETTLALACRREGEQWQLALSNEGATAALWVWLQDGRDVRARGSLYFDDNYFCLLPGERRTVTATWQGVPAAARRLALEGWNFPPRLVGPEREQEGGL